MTRLHRVASAAIAAAIVSLTAGSALAGPPPGTAAPKILVINREALLRGSSAGQSIMQQVQAFTAQAQNDLRGQAQALRAQGQAFQQQAAILSGDVKAKKMKALEGEQQALQAKAQQKQNMIEGGLYAARQQLEKAAIPVLQGIIQERGANMLLDRGAVLYSPPEMDVTALAIQRLNQKLPTVKVTLAPLPPGVQPQQGPQ
jgi:outer membrane protein